MENTVIRERLSRLRAVMAKAHVDYCLMPTADFHNSEYVADFFKAREHFCGFTGSNGTLVVGFDWAGMWTDGRYFIQAEREMAGTGVTLFRMADEGVPTINEYLREHMREGETLGFDGRVVSAQLGLGLEKDLAPLGVRIECDRDLAGESWPDRPPLPLNDLLVIDDALAGKSAEEKLSEVRKALREKNANAFLLSSLDDICWLLNIRGGDVACSPVALSYLFLTEERVILYLQEGEVTADAAAYLDRIGVERRGYFEIMEAPDEFVAKDTIVLYDQARTGYALMKKLTAASDKAGTKTVTDRNPTLLLKAVKNETELKNIREIYIRDSAVLCRFLWWVKTHVGKEPITEVSAAEKLDAMRASLPGFLELSFPTISAYGANAAMMHYEATPEAYAELKPEGMYLVDSGGTYFGGTTDVTRTILLGPVSDEVRRHFTAVAVGMLRLANARFLRGCTGRNLDILARGPVWDMNIDYKCGTGHGVGYMLNVHEGPHNIRWRSIEGEKEAEILPGMIVSDEPGVYIEGSHGIRTESILEAVAGEKNGDGQFMGFRMLTWVPIDTDGIDVRLMQPAEREQLNAYHAGVYERIAPLIEEPEIRAWLKEATKPV
ncbi:MAG: aminopeptidase P family protein [Lachnospiraceae bacterium]|nr:aminopeptidase P family protein [Lachnospiraceae bacterium]